MTGVTFVTPRVTRAARFRSNSSVYIPVKMSPKRHAPSPRPTASPSSCPTPSSSVSSEPHSTKRRRTKSPPSSRPIKLHIVEAKLDAKTLSELVSLAESHSHRQGKRNVTMPRNASHNHHPLEIQLCWDAHEADTIVTAVQMRKRLERHLDWSLAVSIVICICSTLLRNTVSSEREGYRNSSVANRLREIRPSHAVQGLRCSE